MNIKRYFFLLLSVNLCLISPIIGQQFLEDHIYESENAKHRAVAGIQYLKDGALIVRLVSNQNKIDKLMELASSDKLSEDQRGKYKTEADLLTLETRHQQKEWIRAFRNEYQFSEVFFLRDRDYRKFLMGKPDIFLDDQAEIDPAITCNSANVLVLAFGQPSQTENVSAGTSIYIMDRKTNALSEPFPGSVSTRFQDQVLNIILGGENKYRNKVEKLVTRLNKRLTKYCEKHCGEILPPVAN